MEERRHNDGEASARAQKRAKMEEDKEEHSNSEEDEEENKPASIIVQFQAIAGETTGPQLDIPINSSLDQMEQLVNELLQNAGERVPYTFYINGTEVNSSLDALVQEQDISTETVLTVTYEPLAVFRVRAVTRCTDTLPGHTEAILHVSFSPNGEALASGGGDATVRFWDVLTATPRFTCRGHKHHVLSTAWSPDGKKFASGDHNGEVRIWDPSTGRPIGRPLTSHRQWITSLSWEPMHRNKDCERLASSSKDRSVKIWNVRTGTCIVTLSGHSDSVEFCRWGGEGLLYSASRDRTVKVWAMEGTTAGANSKLGVLVRSLNGHGHRVNTLAVSTDALCRTGPFDHLPRTFADADEAFEAAKARYEAGTEGRKEMLVSGSDDFTLFLWSPTDSKKPVARLTGHVQPVNHILFSPDARYFASASFDKKVKVWDGRTGAFVATLSGHVGAVYQVAWSADSRMLVTASKDSTCKLWDVRQPAKAKGTLPGHADEVYALDWSPDGHRVATGSKDRTVKIWRN